MRIQPIYQVACLVLSFLTLPTMAQTQPKTDFKFSFGEQKVGKEYTQVTPTTTYSKERGYGFDYKTTATTINRKKGSFCTSDKPFLFSIALPEGNYNVTITMGDTEGTSTTTVKAESRRLMIEKLCTEKGKLETRTFTVNVRNKYFNNGKDSVGLKKNEPVATWDEKLTLEFNDARPCINSIEIKKAENVVTMYLAGNSTVVDQPQEPWCGWGQMIPRFFKQGFVVANYAESGLALSSFRSQRRLAKILSIIKPNDYLFIEFGHNDQKEKDSARFAHYKENLRYFITEAKKKKAIPVVVTSMNRRRFDEQGKIVNTLECYPDMAREIAKEEGIAVVDLNAMSKVLYEALGVEGSKKAFVIYPENTFPNQPKALADNTHFNTFGGYELSKCIIEGIKTAKIEGIMNYFIGNIPTFNPAQPDSPDTFCVPASPYGTIVTPD